ncbi:MAG: flagellar biosynthetic protein FliR [Planctomycetia bacterium]|nr:flagellar biosynthetic protein FliR [Planctomycetia bacterium]
MPLPSINADLWILSRTTLALLVFFRTAGFFLFLPLFGNADTPKQIRFYCTVIFAFFVVSVSWEMPISIPENLLRGALMLIAEFLIGFCMSAILFIFFSAMNMAGDIISRMAGLSLSAVLDPGTGDQIPVLSQFLFLLGVVVFLVAGGFETLLTGYIDSFQKIPPGSLFSAREMFQSILDILNLSTVLAVRVAAPVILAALSVFLVVGMIGRAVPQLNVMILSFNVNVFLALAVLASGLGFALRYFQDSIPLLWTYLFK